MPIFHYLCRDNEEVIPPSQDCSIQPPPMHAPNAEEFYAEVYDVVRQIPAGNVLSYGRIAELIGWPNHSRMVGRALHDAPLELNLPCHRVVNSVGRTVPGWHQQAMLLMSEGVRIKANGCVDMKACEWLQTPS